MTTVANTTLGPDFVPNETRGPVVQGVTIWLLVIASVFVLLRCISRIGIVRRWSWDDSFMIVAWVLAFGFSLSILLGTRHGLGRHEIYIQDEDQGPLRKSEYAFSVLYNPVLMATKTSILLFFLGLAKNQPVFKWATISTIVVVNVAGFALTLLNILQCRPPGAVFHRGDGGVNATCTDMITIYLSSSPVNVITDLAILVLPFPVLTKMRLPRKQKFILVITFSFGFFVAAVDIVRIAYLQQAFQYRLQQNEFRNTDSGNDSLGDDFSWYASLSFMWSAVEVDVGIICACVPSLKPLVARVLPSLLRDIANPQDNTQRQRSGTARNEYPPSPNSPEGPNSPTTPMRAHLRQTPSEVLLQETASRQPSQSRPISQEGAAESGQHMNGNANTSSEQELDFMEFLTTPDMDSPRQIRRVQTAGTHNTQATNRVSDGGLQNVTFQDFVNMESKKPMTKLSNRQSFAPLAVVTFLFFMWGFAYGLLDVLNSKFAETTGLSEAKSVGLHAAYFGAYFVGPTTIGRAVLVKFGFKATFMVGLCIYGIGTLIFWPSAVLRSFPAFIVCNFIVGLGISVIETAANPFVTLCGPPRHAESRLQISQGLQAIGTVVSPLLAERVFFNDVNNGEALINVQWAYLAIAFFDVLLAVVFYYIPLPEGSDEDFEKVAEKRSSVNHAKFFNKFQVVYVTLIAGMFAQFCYVGAQEGVAQVYQQYMNETYPGGNGGSSPIDAFDWQTIGHAIFAFGRFVCAIAAFVIAPRNVLLILFIGMIITSALMMHLTGPGAAAAMTLYQFFQSGAFPLIFAIPLRGLGAYTKVGGAWLTASIGGGAIIPVIMGPIAQSRSFQYSMCVVVAVSAFGILFPIYLTWVPKARRQVDPVSQKKSPNVLPVAIPDKDGSHRRLSWFSTLKKRPTDPTTAEHVEEKPPRNGSVTTS